MGRPVNTATRELIKSFEGLRLRAYLCPTGHWTIGWGHTRGVAEGDTITADEAEEFLEQDLEEAGAIVDRKISVPLNDNQRGALASSFGFNIRNGEAQLATSTLRRLLNAGDYDAVPAQLRRWVHGEHPVTHQSVVVIPGLVRRREAEVALWLAPEVPHA